MLNAVFVLVCFYVSFVLMYQYLFSPVSAAPLATFRVVMGGMIFFSTVRFMWLGWIEDHFNTVVQFKYYGFYWIPNLPIPVLYLIHVLMLLGAVGLITNFLYRVSATVLFLGFTYCELIDITYYLNHYYFVSLILALFVVLPAHKNPDDVVARWVILLFKIQLGIVYFYAGIAKINYDWLVNALPLRIWLPAQDKLWFIGWIFTYKITPYIFSWAGMIYDCTIPFLLVWKRTRLLAYLAVVVFHTLTGLMFQIGVFPVVMMGATLIFFSEAWHKKHLSFIIYHLTFNSSSITKQTTLNNKRLTLNEQRSTNNAQQTTLNTQRTTLNAQRTTLNAQRTTNNKQRTTLILLSCYLLFQLTFPFRYLLYDGDLFWTEEGYRYSWRVMLIEKAGTATFYVRDSRTGKEGAIDNREFLNAHQEKQMAMQPDMILQFAHFLGKHYAGKGVLSPQVRAEVYVTLNGKPSRLLIKPDVDLMTLQDSWAGKDWIIRYE